MKSKLLLSRSFFINDVKITAKFYYRYLKNQNVKKFINLEEKK